MSLLTDLTAAIRDGGIEVVDLTAPLNDATPVIRLPEPFGNTATFALQEISRYDDRGPAWYWNDISTGEHTGTHFDAPVHWVTGRDGADVAQVPVSRLIAPAVVLDFSAQAAADPDFLLEIEHVQGWAAEHGPLPEGGWLLYRTGWDARSASQQDFLNADEAGPHTPGISVACAQWLAASESIIGLGVETVGTDAGAAHSFDPPFPCHASLLGSGKYGLTQLQNLALLPPTGAVVIAGPLPITGGSGSPCRAIALVEHPAGRPAARPAERAAVRS
ncbi:MAG TPA: cyclase family protein [Streptosporangiaceae bacterium]